MHLEAFLNCDFETQVSLASSALFYKPENEDEIRGYVLANKDLLKAITQNALENNITFASLPTFLQDKVVYDNLNSIRSFSDSKQRSFLSYVNSIETYRYLFSYLVMIDKLEILSSNDILGFMRGIKDFEIFKKLYHKKEIFASLMRKTLIGAGVEAYWYLNFPRMPLEYQIYILNDLKDKKEYAAQYASFSTAASSEARLAVLTEKPKDFIGLVDYYIMTKDTEVKKDIFALLPTFSFAKESYERVITNYPEYFSIEDMEEFFKRCSLDIILGSNNYLKFYNEDAPMKALVVGKIFSSPYVPSYAMGSALFLLSPEEKNELLEKTEKKRLLESSNNPEVLTFLIEKLENDKKYLNGVIDMSLPERNRPSISPSSASMLYKYFTPEQRVYYLGPDKLNVIMHEIDEDPRLIKHINKVTLSAWLKVLPIDSYLYGLFPIDKLVACFTWHSGTPVGIKIKDEFLKRGKDYQISAYDLRGMYPLFTDEDKRTLLLNGRPENFIIAYNLEENPEFKKAFADAIILRQDEIFQADSVSKDYWYLFLEIPDEYLKPILKDLNPKYLLTLYDFHKNPKLEAIIYNIFLEDNYLFNSLEDIDSFVLSLTKEHQENIKRILQEKISLLVKDPHLLALIDGQDTYTIFRFLEKYEKGYFNNPKVYDAFSNLINNTPYLIKTINYDILSPEFISLSMDFLAKVARYPDVEARLIDIKNNNPNSYNIFISLLKKISNDEAKVFDRKMLLLLDAFESKEYAFDHELSYEELDNLLRYILLSSKIYPFSEKNLSLDDINPLTYSEQIGSICDNKYSEANSEYDLKNLIFTKFFDMTYEDVKYFLYAYGKEIDKLDIPSEAKDFVNNIKRIAKCKSIDHLRKIYLSFSPRYSIVELFAIEGEIQKGYSNKLSSSLLKDFSKKGNIIISGKRKEVILPGNDFMLLVHSTNAYSQMPMVDNNYYKSWNASKNVSNHGICTALVSDTCLGFPPLKDEQYGVIFGFNEIYDESLSSMAPYDMFSVNNGYYLTTNRPARFLSAEGLEENTVHTHCEVVLERKSAQEPTGNIQPSCVIITSEMSENQKANSATAASQMNDGKGIPIVYIDIKELVAKKKIWLLGKLNNFKMYHNIEEFKAALSIYESIRCTLFSIKKYDFIKTEYINEVIKEYISYAEGLSYADKLKALMDLEEVLNYEKAKFDITVDSGNRFKALDIAYDDFIAEIYSSLTVLDINNDLEELSILSGEFSFSSSLSKHDNSHMMRVTMLARKIAELMGLDAHSVYLLNEAAKNHDIGRTDDGKNVGHGQRSAEIYEARCTLDALDRSLICAMIEYHEKPDNDLTKEAIYDKYDIPIEQRINLDLLCDIIKDADALDRVRFNNRYASLDTSKLRTKESKLLINYAKELYLKTDELSITGGRK